ncbi:MAG: hypothetical protein Q8K72_05630, partial [Acidimicrobiales bacterium]|nr:hypothetical protein [Acidimicrobiales bacterium]
LVEALADPKVAVILLDVVLGFGGHGDPAGHLARLLSNGKPGEGPALIASVTGTEDDPQGLAAQTAALKAAGVIVCASNAEAAALAAAIVKG